MIDGRMSPRLKQTLSVGALLFGVWLFLHFANKWWGPSAATAAPHERVVTRTIRPTPEPNTIIRWESPCKGAVLHLQPRLIVWTCPGGDAYSARYDK